MKPASYPLPFAVLFSLILFSVVAHADISYSGQLQQELVSWDSSLAADDGLQIRDGGEQQLDSHDAEGATFLALQSTFRLTPNHAGLARFRFDLSQEEGLENYEAYVGIETPSNNWRIGTIASPYRESTVGWDPFLATFMQARGNGGASIYHNGYVEGAINYQSDWWATNVGLQWSPENGSSFSLAHHLTHWDLALAYLHDTSTTVENRAAKVGIRYHSGSWLTAFQYESLNNDSLPASAAYLSLSKQNGITEYGGSFGIYRSDDIAETDLNYIALGMKYALAKNSIIHFGYRLSSAPDDGSQSEKAFGVGFRFSF